MINIPKQLKINGLRFILAEGKKAIDKDWQKTKNYSWEEIEQLEWNGNIGVINSSGKLIVIDSDNEDVTKYLDKNLPETFTVQTRNAKRKHRYYNCEIDAGKIIFRDGLGDCRGYNNNYYTLIPPSIHPVTKKEYKVSNDKPIATITEKQLMDAIKPFLKVKIEKDTKNDEMHISKMRMHIQGLKEVGSEYQGTHPKHGSENGMNFSLNTEKNVWHCFRCDSGGGTLELIAMMEGILGCDECKPGCLKGEKYKETVKLANERYGYDIKIKNEYNIYKKTRFGLKVIYPNLAKQILETCNLDLISVGDESTKKRDFFRYDNGYYKNDGELIIRRKINEILGELSNENVKREVIGYISDMNTTNRSELEPPLNLINVKNGIYDINTNKLLKHNPKYTFLNIIDIEYKDNAKCEKIIKFLNEVLKEEQIIQVQEIFGYCLYRKCIFAKAFIFYGIGRNGKGVLLNLLRKMLNKDNYTARKLHELLTDNFAKADLYCKMANIAGEMNYEDLRNTDNFKELTGRDMMNAERKYKDSFKFENYAKLIFNTNNIPYTHDKTFAFYDRPMIIEFLKRFDHNNPKTDPNLFEKISTDEEMEGLLKWSIEGLQRLLKNEAFSNIGDIERNAERYEDFVNTESEWLRSNYYVDIDGIGNTSLDDIYDKYSKFCDAEGLPKQTKQSLSKTILSTFKNERVYKTIQRTKNKKYIYFERLRERLDGE